MSEIDTSTMSEGVRALLWVIGLLVTGAGGFLWGRKNKVTLDPNKVEVEKTFCEYYRQDNAAEHKNVFHRVQDLEKRVGNLEGQLLHINHSLDRIETKLDNLRISHD